MALITPSVMMLLPGAICMLPPAFLQYHGSKAVSFTAAGKLFGCVGSLLERPGSAQAREDGAALHHCIFLSFSAGLNSLDGLSCRLIVLLCCYSWHAWSVEYCIDTWMIS